MAIALKKTAAIAIAAGLTFAGSAGIAAQDAMAQENVPAVAQKAPVADGIGEAPANLTIHKRVNPDNLRPANGEKDDAPGGQALEGVGFSAQKIKGDITDQATFNKIAKMTQNHQLPKAGELEGEAIDLGKTGTDGATEPKQLPVGAYLITETSVPDNAGEAYVKADPFIVFLPMTTSDGTDWNRDVHVYPKNSMAKVTKTVVDDKVNTEADGRKGEKQVTYTLDGVVPATPENYDMTKFSINDSYNSAELRKDSIESVVVKRGGADVATLVEGEGEDYTVKENTGELAPKAADAKETYDKGFEIILTEKGRAKTKANDRVVATVKATLLNAKADGKTGDQDIHNAVNETGTFTRTPGTGEGFEPKEWETPHDEVVTYVGNIEIYKTGEVDGEKKPLEGAAFDLYRCGDAGNVIQSGVSDGKGLINFEGLHVTNFRNNEDAPADQVFEYCVKETKAPAGYSKDPNEHKITLTKDDRKTRDAKGEYVATENALRMNGVSVNNIKSTVPLLPATGGMGILIVALAGLAIVGGGVYAARRNSRTA